MVLNNFKCNHLMPLHVKGLTTSQKYRHKFERCSVVLLRVKTEENLQREKKVRADVEKAKRKVEADLKMTQEAVEELEKVKGDLEASVKKSVSFYES